jgi:hypothetical protein
MRYFRPILEPAELLSPQVAHEDKLGGLPFGLSPVRWPVCKDCGKPQSLLAQFAHHPERLDLGRTGRVLSVFQCNHDPGMCRTWEGGSGANACVITEPEESTGALTGAPSPDTATEREARIVGWQEQDDGLNADEAARFFNADSYFELPRLKTELVPAGTRLGGVPHWVQSPDEAPSSPWQFVGQLDSTYSFLRPPRADVKGIYIDTEFWEDRTHYCEGPNFGDGGIAYLFVDRQAESPSAWFFWQCG